MINNIERYCLWLQDAPVATIRQIPEIMRRVQAVREFRLNSKAATTRDYADYPMLFRQIAQPKTRYLAFPRVSSERRPYIPLGYFEADVIASDALFVVPDADLYLFGLTSSTMHMTWVRTVGGRLKNDFRYSRDIVYNNFPWPEPTNAQRQQIEKTAQAILDARANHPEATLADLYDPLAMPHDLRKAHQANDRAVDAAYGKHTFTTEAQRVGFLFQRYQSLA